MAKIFCQKQKNPRSVVTSVLKNISYPKSEDVKKFLQLMPLF